MLIMTVSVETETGIDSKFNVRLESVKKELGNK